MNQQLRALEKQFALTAEFPDPSSRFKELIIHAAERSGQRVVVLVDEYDKPILDCITDTPWLYRCARCSKTSTASSRTATHMCTLHF